MIGEIRNPWLRRPLVVLFAPVMLALCAMAYVVDPIELYFRYDFVSDCRAFWREMRADWRIVADAWHGR